MTTQNNKANKAETPEVEADPTPTLKIETFEMLPPGENKRGGPTKSVITCTFPKDAEEVLGSPRMVRKEAKRVIGHEKRIFLAEGHEIYFESKVDGFHIKSPPAEGRKLWRAEPGPSYNLGFVWDTAPTKNQKAATKKAAKAKAE